MVIFAVAFILLEVIFFAVMITVFRKVMTKNVVSATKHLEDLNKEFEQREAEIAKKQEALKDAEQAILAKSREEAEKSRNEIIKRAEDERDSIIHQSRAHADAIVQQADKARHQLLGELDQRIAREAVHSACELIKDSLPENFKEAVHSQWVQELITNGFSKFETLHLPEQEHSAEIVSAFKLSDDQKQQISRKLTAVLNRPLQIRDSTDPSIVVGIVITIGSLVLDGSLRNRIQEKAR